MRLVLVGLELHEDLGGIGLAQVARGLQGVDGSPRVLGDFACCKTSANIFIIIETYGLHGAIYRGLVEILVADEAANELGGTGVALQGCGAGRGGGVAGRTGLTNRVF